MGFWDKVLMLFGTLGEGAASAAEAAISSFIAFASWFIDFLGGLIEWTFSVINDYFPFRDPRSVAFLALVAFFIFSGLTLFLGAGAGLIMGSGEIVKSSQESGSIYDPNSSVHPGGNIPGAVEPDFCGNGVCDGFSADLQMVEIANIPANWDCSDKYVYYNLPGFCFTDPPGMLFTQDYTGHIQNFSSAICGLENMISRLGSKCFYSSGLLSYIENSGNCKADCSGFAREIDLTCLKGPCAWFSCCPEGSYNAWKCLEDVNSCDVPGAEPRTLEQLSHLPYHAACQTSASCAGDFGGNSCCSSGAHEGYCYYPVNC